MSTTTTPEPPDYTSITGSRALATQPFHQRHILAALQTDHLYMNHQPGHSCRYINIGCFLLQCILTTTVSTEYLIQIGPSSRSSRCASRCGPVPRSLVSMVLVLLAIECTNAYGLLCASLPSFQICRSTPSQATLAFIYERYCIPWCIWNHWCIWLTYPLLTLPTVSENISDINDIQY